jgi:hypothetical protein
MGDVTDAEEVLAERQHFLDADEIQERPACQERILAIPARRTGLFSPTRSQLRMAPAGSLQTNPVKS